MSAQPKQQASQQQEQQGHDRMGDYTSPWTECFQHNADSNFSTPSFDDSQLPTHDALSDIYGLTRRDN